MSDITTDKSMIYGLAKAFGSWDNVIIEPDEANTILVERELLIELSKAKAATERVRALHKPDEDMPNLCAAPDCNFGLYPCGTIKALDGE